MMSTLRDPKFYVVGGPVQPGRDCYLQRNADAELLRRVDEGEYCHVLGQRQTGKTSLAASAAVKLWSLGKLVTIVDLTQASEEDPSENAGRWYYSIVYRIVRDLRIKADIQSWWAERGGLTNLQRLREFFNEVVLGETDKPVVVLFDRLEATVGEPRAQDLFAAIRACYDARATDVDFQRLTFVMFGSAEPGELVKSVQGSPFEISTSIPLPDFSPQELSGLIDGLGEPLDDADQLVRRIWSWTRGHPYLSQKVFRALARRKGEEISIDTVDDLVQSQFLGPQTISEEPHLSAIAARLTRTGSGRVTRLNLYGRIRKGVDVMFDSASVPQRDLLTAGVVSVDGEDQLRVRNEIYAMVFGTRWVNQSLPYGVKGIAIAAALLLCVLAAPVWYTEYLPRPYVQALLAANQDYQVAEDAYESLQFIPGYASTADRLFADFLTRSGRQAVTLTEMVRINNRLALMQGGEERARNMLADFWERRAATAAHAGDRDGALLALLEALRVPNPVRRRWAAELVGQDYRNLQATLHTNSKLLAMEVDEPAGLVTLLDAANQVDVWRIDGQRPQLVDSTTVVAEERLELIERQGVEQAGANPRLVITTTHPQPAQVQIRLQAPSGKQAVLKLADGKEQQGGRYVFAFSAHSQLAVLSGDELAGNWTLALSDLEWGVSGELLGWQISFDGTAVSSSDNPVAQPIPEPRSSENARSRLGPGGRLAVSWPKDIETQGSVLLWDLSNDAVIARLPRSREFVDARFVLNGERVVVIDGRQLTVYETATGRSLTVIDLVSPGSLRLSDNGRFAALDITRPDKTPGIVVWDLQRLRRVGQMITAENAGPVSVDSAGKYLAIGGRDPWVRVWSLLDATLVKEFEHSSPLRSVQFDPTGQWLATDDLSSTFRVWNVAQGGAPVIERFGISDWFADFAADGSSLMFGSSDRAFQVVRLPDGQGGGIRMRQSRSGDASGAPVMLATLNLALTTDASRSVKVWSVPGVQSTALPGSKPLPAGTRAVLSADGQRIAIGTTLGDVRIVAAGAPGGMLLGGNAKNANTAGQSAVICLAFSDDRRLLASASIDGRVRVWDADNSTERDYVIVHPDGGAHDLLFIDNGRYLVSSSRGEVLVTDVASGEISARLRIQANHPQLALARSTGDLYIADDQNGVTVWNWRDDEARRIVGSEYQIRTLAVNDDGSRMATASDGRELILWNLEEIQPLGSTVQAAGKVDDMWLTQDGQLVVQAGYWLQSVNVFPRGLSMRRTRLLSEAPASVKEGSVGDSAFVLLPSPSRPLVSEVFISEPPVYLLEGDPEELRRYWRERLAITLDEQGNAQPVPGQIMSINQIGAAIGP
jgi:WD40 repeat protein